MVARQSKMAIKNHNTDHRVKTHTYKPSSPHQSESEVAQSCPTLRDPMDCSLPGSSVHGIFQARVLEWVAIAFSKHICRHPQKTLANQIQ